MAEAWEDEGAWGSAARVPVDQWFPIRTDTGEWQLPGQPTLARSAGMPDVTAPAVMGGLPDQAPLAIGQVAGTMAPQLGPQPRLAQMARLSGQGLLPEQPSMWESIARAVGQASPTGHAILQASDQQQQQQLQNRLVQRRQQLLEEQESRQVVKDEYAAFADLSKIKNKALRNLQFDRIVAQRAEAGKPLPTDFVEAFKKSSLVEGEGIAQAYGHLLRKVGFDDAQVTNILENSDAATIKDLLQGTIQVKKAEYEETEAKQLQRIQSGQGGTLADVSGVAQPTAPGTDQRPRGYVESGTTQPIVGSEKLTPSFTAKTKEVADRLGMDHQHLLRIISFETGGTFDPAVKNRAGSGATGLIQFMPDTAKALGTTTEALAKMTPEQQLDYVEKYLTPYKGKLGNLKDAYLAVLKPAALGQGLDAPLFTRDTDGKAYLQNAGLDTGGKGQVTVGDALGAVMRTTTGGGTQTPPPDTRSMVAGPGAPAPAPGAGDTAALTRLKEAIAAKQGQIQQLSGLSSERANKVADNMRADLKILQEQYNRLEDRQTRASERAEETPRAVARDRALYEEKGRQQAQPMLPEDRRKLLTGLRSDIRQEPTFKLYQEVRNGYQNVQVGAKRDSSEGDLALIYGLAKILDPQGVVREQDFQTVASAQGKLQQLLNSPQRFFEGDRLTPANRQKLLTLATSLSNEKLTTAQKELRAVYEPLAKEGNIDFNQLLPLGDLKTSEGQSLLEDMRSAK
jgi:Transglycosylase SLT domain